MKATLHAQHPAVLAKRADRGYAAALHILGAPMFESDARVWGCVHLGPNADEDRYGIDFGEMLEDVSSTGERLMIQAACSLFNGDEGVNLFALTVVLDVENLRRVVAAIEIRAGLR